MEVDSIIDTEMDSILDNYFETNGNEVGVEAPTNGEGYGEIKTER